MSEYNQRLRLWDSLFAWIMQNTKGVSHLLNPFVHFFCVAQKKWTKEKGAAARCLSRVFLAPALPDAADARVVSRHARRFRFFFYLVILFCSTLRTFVIFYIILYKISSIKDIYSLLNGILQFIIICTFINLFQQINRKQIKRQDS